MNDFEKHDLFRKLNELIFVSHSIKKISVRFTTFQGKGRRGKNLPTSRCTVRSTYIDKFKNSAITITITISAEEVFDWNFPLNQNS